MFVSRYYFGLFVWVRACVDAYLCVCVLLCAIMCAYMYVLVYFHAYIFLWWLSPCLYLYLHGCASMYVCLYVCLFRRVCMCCLAHECNVIVMVGPNEDRLINGTYIALCMSFMFSCICDLPMCHCPFKSACLDAYVLVCLCVSACLSLLMSFYI